MIYKFCPTCGHELLDKSTESSWTRVQRCECGVEIKTFYGDSMGGSSDVVQIKQWNKGE